MTYLNGILEDGCEDMMSVVSKYFFLPGLRLGWSLLQAVDPFIGPAAAGAILCVLTKMGLINLDPDVKNSQLIRPEVPVGNRVNEDTLAITSITHAFPGISVNVYQNLIMESFSNADAGVAAGIVHAYELSNPYIIHELLSISQGKLLFDSNTNNETLEMND